ncbi:MAG: hydrogenase expression/formation protein [Pseudomonadales bacterium]|jgi:hydrogenase-1 operon protein HyaF|uniref:hydrogenase expression/formation protein n=1 Tax=unclassified Ketobacter TaxID=2639109 RepID=UPI000C675D86|nr:MULTISPECIES: hydrogenase expression/formation protein [unclassified Ketobacter]MAQ23851.1 hydrogenase expression/formation protein [Pseudomonadales bacterium]MEC8811442.1 hydrogenase expression/formation C-terminal domain-containing protein [Pseudomonadota bacterium]HAG93975.1 hydrogenase expression/formation protein [Gammaproteobacteria bacterium]MBI26164.1 hydrogenase expression/formation protein [Pseudomonadales bacterium]RLT91597.1 MAG: hydrogenase expression/formation protein [Ketobac|tara:strand:- start:8044 stop:8928 length:885 start_codon:yes stop_codon:yes gene_type:complete
MSDSDRIPVVSYFGPGSQPQEFEESFQYLSMPTAMTTYHQPQVPEPEDAGHIEPALKLLQRVLLGLQHYPSKGNALFPLSGLNQDSLRLVNQMMGVGEVSATIGGASLESSPIHIQESVMAGLWRVQQRDVDDNLIWDGLEVGAVPACVTELAFADAAASLDTDTSNLPTGVMNVPALLSELANKITERAQDAAQGQPAHVMNLTLLPLSDADLFCLGERLGVGPVTFLSRGYGNCRVGSTACNNVWWIKYFNSEDALILNTIEVTNMPEVVMAAPEDIADSAHRLQEILEIYR